MGARWGLVLALAGLAAGTACARSPTNSGAQQPAAQVIPLWPGKPTGTEDWTGPEEQADAELPNLGKVHVITNVTQPTLTVVRPTRGKAIGTAMIIVPGGAFRALPWDLDGLETARWLTNQGITAFILKYRVHPPSAGTPPDRSFEDFAKRTKPVRDVAVADAEQAVRLVRSRAIQFGVARDRIGMIGFSAGAMTTALAADAPDAGSRPDFAAALYGALLEPVGPSASAAPIFIVAAQDDPEAPPLNSVEMFERWTKASRPAELHLYEHGGHGFAFRRHNVPADRWPEAFRAWLQSRQLLPAPRS